MPELLVKDVLPELAQAVDIKARIEEVRTQQKREEHQRTAFIPNLGFTATNTAVFTNGQGGIFFLRTTSDRTI